MERFVPIIIVMMYILNLDDYLEILNDDEVKDFLAIYFGEYFKYIILEKLLNHFISF